MAPNGRGADGRDSRYFDILGEYYAKIPRAGWLEIFRDGAGRAHPTSKRRGRLGNRIPKAVEGVPRLCSRVRGRHLAGAARSSWHGQPARRANQPRARRYDFEVEALIEAEPKLFAAALADTREKIA